MLCLYCCTFTIIVAHSVLYEGKIVKKIKEIHGGLLGGEPTLFQLKVSAPVQVSKDNRTAKETINALICMRRTALRQLLWHRLFAYICSRQAFMSLCEAKCRPRVAVFWARYMNATSLQTNIEVLGLPLVVR